MEAKDQVIEEMKSDGLLSLFEVQKRGEPHRGEVIEFCMKLMSRSLSAPQARDVLRDIMTSVHPNLKHKRDYQIPSEGSLKRYRRCLYLVANHRMILAINEAEGAYLIHDASTKKGKSIFQTSTRLVKSGVTVDAPVGFNILKNGESATEADAINAHLTSSVDETEADVRKVDGVFSDGANGAGKTSDIWLDGREKKIKSCPEFQAMSEQEKEVLLGVVKGRCGNHNLSLMSSASFANEEKVLRQLIHEDTAYEEHFDVALATELCTGMNRQYDAQEESDRPAVTQLLRAIVFLFEQHGKNSEYYLNEGDQILEWMKTPEAAAVAKMMYTVGLQDTNKPKLHPLPPMKGSRQHVWIELAYWVVLNYRYYYAYLEQLRIRSNPNKLVRSVHRGLKDKYILAALAARALTWMCEIWPARFLINDLADRQSLYSIFSCMLTNIQSRTDSATKMLLAMAEQHPHWKTEITSFIKNAEKDSKIIAKYATHEVDPVHVAKFRAARVVPMLASAERNVDRRAQKQNVHPLPLIVLRANLVQWTRHCIRLLHLCTRPLALQ